MGKGTNTTTSTNTPPADVLAEYDKVVGNANQVAQTPYQSYNGQLTAPVNSIQNSATGDLAQQYGNLGAIGDQLNQTSANAGAIGSNYGSLANSALGTSQYYGGELGALSNVAMDSAGNFANEINGIGSSALNSSQGYANNLTGIGSAAQTAAQNIGNQIGGAANTLGGLSSATANTATGIGSLANVYQPYYNAASAYTSAGANALSPENYAKNVSSYMSPYTQDVVNATQNQFNNSNAQQQQNVISSAIASGNAFGGDRMGVDQSVLAGQQDLAQAPTIAGLYNSGYTNAQGELNTAAQNALTAGVNYGNLGTGAQAAALAAPEAQIQGYSTAGNLASNQASALGLQGSTVNAGFNTNLNAQNSAAAVSNQGYNTYGNLANSAGTLANQGYSTAGNLASAAGSTLNAGISTAGNMNSGALSALGVQNQSSALQQANNQLGTNDANSLLAAGTLAQTTQQAQDAAAYQQFENAIAFPYQQTGWLGNIAEGIGTNEGGTTTTTSPAPFFSDKRLKTDEKVIGKSKDGQNIYLFRYKGDPDWRVGLMAQEVQKKHPDAVSSHGGILAVDYKAALDSSSKKPDKRGSFAFGGSAYSPGDTSIPGEDATSFIPNESLPVGSSGAPMPGRSGAPQTQSGLQQTLGALGGVNGAIQFGKNVGPALSSAGSTLGNALGFGAAAGAPAATEGASLGALGSATPLASAAGAAGAGAAAGAAGVATADAAGAGAAAAGAGAADFLPFLALLKRGGAVNRRAYGGRVGYDDGGVVDDFGQTFPMPSADSSSASPYGNLGAAAQTFAPQTQGNLALAPQPAPMAPPSAGDLGSLAAAMQASPSPSSANVPQLAQPTGPASANAASLNPYGDPGANIPVGTNVPMPPPRPADLGSLPDVSAANASAPAPQVGTLGGGRAMEPINTGTLAGAPTSPPTPSPAIPSRGLWNAPVYAGPKPDGASPNPSDYPTTAAGQAAFIHDYAAYRGVDPKFALSVANAEGLRAISPNNPSGASYVDIDPKTGKPFSFGAFQLNVRNGLGNVAMANGIDPTDPSQANLANKFALDQMAQPNGLKPWQGDKAVMAYQGGQDKGSGTLAYGGGNPANAPALNAINSATSPTSSVYGSTASNDNGLFGTGIKVSPEMGQALLAGVFGMLASPSHTLAGAIGSGGLAGLGQYNTAQRQQSEIAKNTLGLAQQRFTPSVGPNGQLSFYDSLSGAMVSPQQRAQILTQSLGSGNSSLPMAPPSQSVQAVQAGAGTVPATSADVASGRVPAGVVATPTSTSPTPSNPIAKAQSDADADPTVARFNAMRDDAYQKAAELDRQASLNTGINEQAAQRYATQANAYRAQGDNAAKIAAGYREQLVKPAVTGAEEAAKNAQLPNVDPATGAKYVGGNGSSAIASQPGVATGSFGVDPETAKINTAIPAAPKGGGYIVPNLPPGAKLTELPAVTQEQIKADNEFLKDQVATSRVTDSAIARTQAIAQAFKTFQSGALADHQHDAAALATSLGQPEIAAKIMNGSISGAEWVDKEGVNSVLDTLKAATPRFAQSEFNAVAQKGTPNTTNQPQANHEMVSEMLAMAERNKAFMSDWEQAKTQGWSSPTAFYTAWQQTNPLNGFIKGAQRQIGNFAGMDLPNASDWTKGSVYVAPAKMPAAQAQLLSKYGVQPGAMFRFNGRNAAGKEIEPVSKSDYFSAQLGQ